MKLTTRELVTITVFGALWGIVEISLGSVLKALQVPLSGAVLAGIGLTIVIIGRAFVPRRGSTLFAGVIAMLLKLFSIGNIIIGPIIGILAEALLAEIALSIFGKPSRLSFTLAGALGVLWTLVHPFFTGWAIFGRDMLEVWQDLIKTGNRLLGIDPSAALAIVLALIAIHLLIGAIAGLLAWSLGDMLRLRLSSARLISAK